MPIRSLRSLCLAGFAGSLLALRAFAADGAPVADAPTRGLLGQSRVGVAIDWYRLQDAAPLDSTAQGVSLEAFAALSSWLDVGINHQRVSVHGPAILPLVKREETLFRGVVHGGHWSVAQPFVDLGLGRATQKVFRVKETGTAIQFGAGLEVPVSASLVLTPRVDHARVSDFDEREWRYGLGLDWRFARHWSAGLSLTHAAVAGGGDYQRYAWTLRFVF